MVRYLDQYDDDEENARAAADLGLQWPPPRPDNKPYDRRYKARRRGELAPFVHVDRVRLEANAERQPNGCLLWQRARNDRGYGHLRVNGKQRYAHRLALAEKLGRPIGPGLKARHTCHTRLCIEQDHLVEGTQHQNVHDMIAAGRAAWQRRSLAES